MSNSTTDCPPANIIAAFASGELSVASSVSVQAHISRCESCLETVGHLAGSRSSHSGASVAAIPELNLSQPGQLIGAYRLIRKLGEGGMGEVWQAEQQEPVRRVVALKLLKSGMDTRQIVVRFAAERQVLALMQHPSIAQMFDAGVSVRGRSYFVMEYVDGQRITTYCDQAALDLRERLLLFQQVCDAVQHAHQKGVIHRDIKPSNVLVTMQDGRALPKVIDFGLAKLTASEPSDATLTEVGTLLGTPAYASPEQMSLGVIDVDTRSDVYSLGVLLYELLIGVIPFEAEDATPVAMLELRRSIREREPSRPSARLSKLGERASNVAKLRRTETSALRRQLDGDLDRIVMKALEKDRSRRYASPGDLARDTQRYLAHEPVLAGSPTPAYRLGKFVRRHRVGTGFAFVLLSLVVAFIAVSAVQVQRITLERDRATFEAAKASSISTFLQETLGSADPWQTGSDISVRATLERAAGKLDVSFADQPLIAAAVRRTIGKTYAGLGRYSDAEPLMRAALDARISLLGPDHADIAESLADLAVLYRNRGDYDLAEKAGSDALALRRKLFGNSHPRVADSLLDRAALLNEKGDFSAAEQAAKEALVIRELMFGPDSDEVASVLEELGSIAASGLGDLVRGEQLVRRGYEIRQRLFGPDDVRTLTSESMLASNYLYQQKPELAEVHYRNAYQGLVRHLGQDHPDTIIEMENLANALARLGRFDESSTLMKDVLAQRRAVLGDENRVVARTMVNIGTDLSRAGRLEEAEAAYAEGLPRFARAYGHDHPDNAYVLYVYGVLLWRQHKYADAEPTLRDALSIQVIKLGEDHPTTAETRIALGEVLTERGQFGEAEKLLVHAHAVMLKAYGPDVSDTRDAVKALDKLRIAMKKPAASR